VRRATLFSSICITIAEELLFLKLMAPDTAGIGEKQDACWKHAATMQSVKNLFMIMVRCPGLQCDWFFLQKLKNQKNPKSRLSL
jgi:hypothetical protein